MTKEKLSKEKSCLFFASDYHFEMIVLPYITKELKKGKEIVVLSDNNLEDTIKIVVSKINLKEEKIKKILDIDWKNEDLKKFKEIRKIQNQGKEIVLFIKGKENYIRNVNNNIKNWINKEKTKIIDCYDIDEVLSDVGNIVKNYNNILTTINI